METGSLHHIELWVPDLTRSTYSIGWLLERFEYQLHQTWENGRSWILGETYIVIEQSPALTSEVHDRLRPGLNHLAFHSGSRGEFDKVIVEAQEHGWPLLFPDRHPFAGGLDTYAGYLADSDGFEVELVSD
jgi:catechol 2,3-dioxygenase-like lactoylglutathione lyase family enzyme